MTALKSNEIESWLRRPDPSKPVILIYGPDQGLVSERASGFVRSLGLPLDDPFSVTRLTGTDLDGDPGRLLDEARTVAMFASDRLIWVRDGGSSKGFVNAVADLIDNPPEATRLLIEAGDLKKSAGGLRGIVEKAGTAVAIPCYSDRTRDLLALIDETLREAGLSITQDARQILSESLGANRLVTRGELEKLVLYAAGEKQINADHILASVGDAAAFSADTIADAVLVGDLATMDRVLDRLIASGQDVFVVLNAVQRAFQQLEALRRAVDENRTAPSAAVAAAKPPIFFTRRDVFIKAVDFWRAETIVTAQERLHGAVLETRRRPDLAVSTTRQLLIALCVAALRGRRSG